MTSSRTALQDKKTVNTMSSHNSSSGKKAPPAQAKRAPTPTPAQKIRPSVAAPKGQGIVTPINKYAHVPSRVFSGLTQPAPRPTAGKPAVVPSQPPMSHEDVFGFPQHKAAEPVGSVLQRSRFMSPQKSNASMADDNAVAEPSIAITIDAAAETMSATTVTTPLRRGPSASSSFKDLVMDDSEDIPARRSLSHRPSGASLPRPRSAIERPHNRPMPAPLPAPRSCVTLPESTDEDTSNTGRQSRWSVNARFQSPPQSNNDEGTTTAPNDGSLFEDASVVISLKSGSVRQSRHSVEVDRVSEVLSRHSHASSNAFSAISPLTDVSRRSDATVADEPRSGRLSEALRASSLDLGAATPMRSMQGSGRVSTASSVAQHDVPPNSPASARVSVASSVAPHDVPPNSPAGSLMTPRGSRLSTGSMVGPEVPPNTPAEGTPVRLSARHARFSTGSVGIPCAPPSTPSGGVPYETRVSTSWAELLWPRRSGSGSLARSEEHTQGNDFTAQSPQPPYPSSPFKSLMEEEVEDSAVPFDIASPPPSAPSSRTSLQLPVSMDDAPARGSIGGGLFARIRNSINLHLSKGSHNESPAGSEKPLDAVATPGGQQRRRSVAFCSPDRLEVRVDHNTPRGTVKSHNVDADSPAPILVRTPTPKRAAASQPSLMRSDSPSRPNTTASSGEPSMGSMTTQSSNPVATSLPLPQPSVPRAHTVDRLGRICRSKTPGRSLSPTDRDYEAEEESDTVERFHRSPPPVGLSVFDMTSPPPLAPAPFNTPDESQVERRVEHVIQQHTAASALRMLTVTEIATFLAARDVAFDPAERKAKLFDAARRLVLSVQRTSVTSSERAASEMLSLPRPNYDATRKRLREDDVDADSVPTNDWTVSDIRRFAQDRDISLHGVPPRKANLLRHISQSLGRSPSADMLSM